MQSPKKTFVSFAAALMLLPMCRAGFGQQWQGNNNTTDPINRTGSVGIGTTTPQGKFDVGNAFYTAAGLITIRGLRGVIPNAYEGGDLRFEGGTDTTTSTTYPSFNLDNYQGHFRFLSSGGTKFFVTNTGRFGIGFGPGFGMPQAQLHLIAGSSNPNPLRIGNGTANFTMDVGASLGMTNLVAGAKVDSIYNPSVNPSGYRFLANNRGASRIKLHDGAIEFYTSTTTNGSIVDNPVTGLDTVRVAINNLGNVGIGLASPPSGYRLSVNGKIKAKEIVVENTGWPDAVFANDHRPKSLEEVEQYVKQHKRLPDMPSQQEVAENGVSLGEMQAKLLQKIEELTLYVIELKKENDKLYERVDMLEKKQQ